MTDYSLETYSVDMGNWYSQYSDLTSNPYDPMPLAPPNARITGGLVDDEGNPINVFTYGSWLLAAVAAAGFPAAAAAVHRFLLLLLLWCRALLLLNPGTWRSLCCSGVNDQLLASYCAIERFWKPSLINAVLPVVLVFTLGLMTFFEE